jgi:hypothetical protein
VKVISFEQKDVSDWIEAGGTADELWRMVDAAQYAEPEDAIGTLNTNSTGTAIPTTRR